MSSIIFNTSKTKFLPLSRFISNQRNQFGITGISRYSTEVKSPTESETKIGGFAQAFQKYTNIKEPEAAPEEVKTFASLLRSSKFIDLGDPEGKIVTGVIFQVVNDDLYIDFGWKFYCVCTRPPKNSEEYVRGTKVRLMIKDLELSSRFLGSEKDLTLLEADCKLLSIIYSPARR